MRLIKVYEVDKRLIRLIKVDEVDKG